MPETQPTILEEEVPDTQRMVPTTIQTRAELDGVLDALGSDEVRVLVRIAERLKAGATTYGTFHLKTDTRAFRREASEELEDALVYLACAWLKAETRRSAHE